MPSLRDLLEKVRAQLNREAGAPAQAGCPTVMRCCATCICSRTNPSCMSQCGRGWIHRNRGRSRTEMRLRGPIVVRFARDRGEIAHRGGRPRRILAELKLDEQGSMGSSGRVFLLGLQTIFKRGSKRCGLDRTAAPPPHRLPSDHTDFDADYPAEVIAYDDSSRSGEAGAKEAGNCGGRKEYIVKEGDVMHFRFNVRAWASAAMAPGRSRMCQGRSQNGARVGCGANLLRFMSSCFGFLVSP